MGNNIKKKAPDNEELDLTVFMSLMVDLIPILLASAEFAKIATIDISLPKGRGSQVQTTQAKPTEEEDTKLILTAMLTDSALTLGAKSGFMPSIFYKEFHKYVSKDDGTTLDRVEYRPDKLDRKTGEYPDSLMPENPKTGEKYTIHEREEIFLIAYETYDNNQFTKPIQGLYSNEFSELITDKAGNALVKVGVGDVVYALTTRMSPVSEEQIEKLKNGDEIEARRPIKITDPSVYTLKDLSAYDAIKSLLVQIRERYPDAEDRDNLIIAAENQIVYDKIIQIMDAARSANLPNISIAKFRM